MRTVLRACWLALYLCTFGALVVFCQNAPEEAVLFQELQSPQTTDQAAAKLLKIGKTDSNVRKYLGVRLPPVIQKHPKYSSKQWTNAVRLAGELKIADAAPALAGTISLDDLGGLGGFVTTAQVLNLETNPAGKALAQIGDPAIPAITEVLKQGSVRERTDAIYMLHFMGSARARSALQEHLGQESNVNLRGFIQRMLNMWGSDRTIHPRPPARRSPTFPASPPARPRR